MIRFLREIAILALLLGLLWFAGFLRTAHGQEGEGGPPGLATMTLGFALLAAHLCGRLFAAATLPMITGYLLAGVLLGPHILGLIGLDVRDRLLIINRIALGLIALTAGGELAISRIRPRLRAIGSVTLLQTVGIFGANTGAVLLLVAVARRAGAELALSAGLHWGQVLAMGLILSLVATANSPSSTVALINETRARGPLTTLALGVTVVKDVVIIILMGVTLSVATTLVDPEASFNTRLFLEILLEVLASLAMGAVLGGIIIAYLARVEREAALFLLGMVFVTAESADWVHHAFGLHPHFLLICMAAGFLVENASAKGEALVRGLERSSLPIYVVFFTLSGVGLDLASLRLMWPLALGFVALRCLLIYTTTWAGTRIAGEDPVIRRVSWTAFLAQAGVSLGLAELVATRYPEMGERIKTVVLATIAINQLIGPPLFKLALKKAGEIGRAVEEDEGAGGELATAERRGGA
jgi:Kef-type K+ transport system membrane component KefB